MTTDDLVLIARYFCVKHDPYFDTSGISVIDAEGEEVIICNDEYDAIQMASALNRLVGHP